MLFYSLLRVCAFAATAAAAATNSAVTTSFCLTGLNSTPTSTITTTTTTSTTTLSTVTVTSKITPVTTIVPPSQTVVLWKTVTTTSTLNLAKVTDVYYTYTSTSIFTQTNLYTASFNTTAVQTITVSSTDAVTVPTPSGFTALGDQILALGYSTYGNAPFTGSVAATAYGYERRKVGKRTTTAASSTSTSTSTSSSLPQYPQYVICDEIVQVMATSIFKSTASTTKTVSKTPKTITKTSTISVTNTKTITPKHASTTISTVTSSTLTTQSTVSLTSTATSLTTTTAFNPAATHFAICDSNNIINSVNGQYDLYPYPDAMTANLGASADMTPEQCCTLCALDPNCATSWLLPGSSSNQCYAFYNQDYVCNPTGNAYPYAGELYIYNGSYGYSGTYVSNSNCGQWNIDGVFAYS